LWIRISAPTLVVAVVAGVVFAISGVNPELAATFLGVIGLVIFLEVLFWESRALFQRPRPRDDD
jgi:hypothetical protein